MERQCNQKVNKWPIVLMPDAIIQPNTMVIKLFTASIAFTTMLSLILHMSFAAFTEIYIFIFNKINIILLRFFLLLRLITWINYASLNCKY